MTESTSDLQTIRCDSLIKFFNENQKETANITLNDDGRKIIFKNITDVKCIPVGTQDARIVVKNNKEEFEKYVDSITIGGTRITRTKMTTSFVGWKRESYEKMQESCISLTARISDEDLPNQFDSSKKIRFSLDSRNHQILFLCGKTE